MKTPFSDMHLPNDPSGTAFGIGLRVADIQEIIRPGLLSIQNALPSLAMKAREIIQELDDPTNPLAHTEMRVIKIDRKVSKKHLRRGRLKVLDCDKRKIFALLAALYSGGSKGRDLAGTILPSLVRAGIPVRVEGEPTLGGSVFFKLLGESLEMKLTRPA